MELKEGDYLIVSISKFMDIGVPEWIVGGLVDSSKFYVIKKKGLIKVTNYNNYTIGILLELDGFIPLGTTFKIYPPNHKSNPGCSSKFKIRKSCKFYKDMSKSSKYFCRKNITTNENISKNMQLLVKINKIDTIKKYIDLSIGKCYKLV